MKTITFTPFNKEDYAILCEALTGSTKPVIGIAQMQLQKKIFDKLGVIGRVKDKGPSRYHMELVKEGGTIELEDAEWQFGKELLENVGWMQDGALKGLAAVELWYNAKEK